MLFMVQFSTAHFYFWNIYINLLIEYLHSVRSPADHKMDDFEALMSQFEETPGPVETPGETTAPVAVENSAPPYSLLLLILSNLKKKKEKVNKRPLATMQPRVQCSKCDYSGKEGAEMKEHMRRSHQTKFRCKECSFETKYNILRRRHMMNAHQKKCENVIMLRNQRIH